MIAAPPWPSASTLCYDDFDARLIGVEGRRYVLFEWSCRKSFELGSYSLDMSKSSFRLWFLSTSRGVAFDIMVKIAKRGQRQSASVIAQQLSTVTGRQVSRFTVARRLHKGGLFAHRPQRCLPFKVDHRRHRLQCCREHKHWTTVNRVVSSLRMRVGSVPEAIDLERYWDTVLYKGSVIGDRYCEEVLLPHVHLFRGTIGPDFIFMDDNARPHRTLAVEELLESEDITRMDWIAYSPDLNPIEHVWDALGRRIAARLHHPKNTQQLKQMLIEEWAFLPQEMLHQLVLSIRRRCEATIAVRGGHIPY
ncbi:transposable element Tcb2 transposase [Trichonephila clavipes]|nr:transposable element Tcb2 transposase [Trichonephila clavipes]